MRTVAAQGHGNALHNACCKKVSGNLGGVDLRIVQHGFRREDAGTEKVADVMAEIYRSLFLREFPIVTTDDMRDAPSLTIVPALVGGDAKVRVVDPQGQREGMAPLPGIDWRVDRYVAAVEADLVVILTEWNEFRALDLAKLSQHMTTARIADHRNI